MLAVSLDVTVLSVALPTLATALKASESQLQWFSVGYTLVLAAAMLPAGLLGDRFGRKKILLTALVLFAAGSIACAYAPSPSAFIAARAVLGVAGAGLITMALSALTVLFSEQERPRAVAVWGVANFLALPIGPILGGWLLTHYWWGWVFLMNVPVAALGFLAVVALVPESSSGERTGIDLVGVVASSAGLAILTYGLIEAGQHGWGNARAWTWMISGLLVLVAFALWESWLGRRPGGQPLVDFNLFRSASFTWGVLLMTTGMLAMIGMLFTMPQYFQAVLGADAQGSGLRLLPMIVGIVAGAGVADQIAARTGQKLTVALGFVVIALGCFTGARMAVDSSVTFIAVWMAVVGAGMGLIMATSASAALMELPAERSGVASGVMQAFLKLGAPFGGAILGSVLNSTYQSQLHLAGLPAAAADAVRRSVFGGVAVAHQLNSSPLLDSVRSAFVAGMDDSLRVSAAIAVAGILLALVFLPRRSAIIERKTQRVKMESGNVA